MQNQHIHHTWIINVRVYHGVHLPGVVYVVVAAVAPHGQVAEAEGQHVLRLRGVAQAVARHIPRREDR